MNESIGAVWDIGVMDPRWCSKMTGKIRRVDEKCKFEQFFTPTVNLASSDQLLESQEDHVADIGVMDPEWCSEMTSKIKRLDEKCKFEQFFKPDESPITSVDDQLWESQEDDVVDITDEVRITTLGNSHHSNAPENFWYFNSTREASKKLLDALKDEKSNIVGLYGKKGSGKTTLVTADKAEYRKTFDQVLFVTGSDIQGRIISQLNLRFEENTSNLERSYKIKSILESKKKVLVILDDVPITFDPRDIGIPDPSEQCKLLWITRDKKTLNTRRCYCSIYLHPLSGEDPWKLLQQYAGIEDDDDSDKELVNVAREVAGLCKGLPGQIRDVVSSLENKNTDEDDRKLKQYWKESFDCLKHETARYQIFISFRGTDTRDHFTESLYDALHQEGFKVFIDREIRSGDRVSETLFNVIEQSRASIVVLSQNYAQSSWCLDELLKIMECEKEIQQLVYPIFFKVDPSHVKHLLGTYKEAMAKKKERFGEVKVQEWTSALHEVGGFSGKHYEGGSYKTFIQEVVEYAKGNKHRLHVI